MRTIILIALAIALVGCGAVGAEVPHHDFHEVPTPDGSDIAITRIVSVMEGATGIKLPPITVHWTDDLLPYGTDGAVGLTFSCDDIWVRTQQNPLAGKVPYVLSHEIAHCALWASSGDSDHNHTQDMWWGDYGIVHQAHVAANSN